ncbi:unnamed protein product [Dovyalis caffra]|uniref:Uncharacterized protein n=1 Tax=Dovyalis caffra TaxID=77055 RepID=A0AAV1RSF3_9ROSI|nr:unnamed protein product [Dovyalis caffra]
MIIDKLMITQIKSGLTMVSHGRDLLIQVDNLPKLYRDMFSQGNHMINNGQEMIDEALAEISNISSDIVSKTDKIKIVDLSAIAESSANPKGIDDSAITTEFIQERRAKGFLLLNLNLEKIINTDRAWFSFLSDHLIVLSNNTASKPNESTMQKLTAIKERILHNRFDSSEGVHKKLCQLLGHKEFCRYCESEKTVLLKRKAPTPPPPPTSSYCKAEKKMKLT